MKSNRSSMSGRRLGRGRVLVAGMCAASLAVLAVGCGGQQDDQASSGAGSGQQLVVAQASTTPVGTARDAGQAQSGMAQAEGIAASSADALPPDVAVTVVDTLVFPGSSVELKAEGSPDVIGVTLSDGLGRQSPFVYDAATDTWRVFYRVPMRSPTERIALSVTAKNAPGRWRRVWLFLHVQHETLGAQPDSSSKP